VSSLGSGKPHHPMRNSRLLFLVRRLSFTLSTKYCILSLLDASNMFKLVRIEFDFTPADVDVSLKDLPPESSETVCSFCLCHPVWHTVRGGQKEHTLSGKLDCLRACEDRASSPTLTVFVNFQTLSTIINRPSSINSWLITRWSYQQLVDK
jgi:hypothetical protein